MRSRDAANLKPFTVKFPDRKAKVIWWCATICRVLLGVTFIFSGFVKAVDPWGTGIKVGEYLAAFEMEWIYGWRFAISIWMNGAELMMGLMLLFKIRLRLVSIFASAAMLFFTVLTLALAIWNPVEDCGCFGEAIKLTNWETFIKNLILLPMAFFVLWSARKMPIMPAWRDGAFMLLFGSIAFGIGIYSYYHLPIIDFLPYKIGTNLPEAMSRPSKNDVETRVIYRDRQTGKEKEFLLSDTTWYDDTRWEFVDTRTVAIRNSVHPSVRDFAIFDHGDFITREVLEDPGVVYMVCAAELSDIKRRCEKKLAMAVSQAERRGYRVMCLTAESLNIYPGIMLGDTYVDCYNMDSSTIKTMLRSKVGVVVLKGGTIIDKVSCRDMLEKGELPDYASY